MIILLDTSTPVCHLTLFEGGIRTEYNWESGRELAKGLLGYIESALAETGKTWTDISGIGVLKGPGSFTGLRIGLTVLNTLANSLPAPIVGVTGEDWQQLAIDQLLAGNDEKIVMPEYGGDATITTPRK